MKNCIIGVLILGIIALWANAKYWQIECNKKFQSGYAAAQLNALEMDPDAVTP